MGKKNKNKRKRSLSSDGKDTPSTPTTPTTPKTPTTSEAMTKNVVVQVPKVEKVSKVENPLLEQQTQFLKQKGLTETERYEFFSPDITSERRAELWMAQADLGEDLVNRYAWATPDDTAIRILKEFSPLVEIGCGSNAYWCRILQQHGIDIIGYDVNVASGGKINGANNDTTTKTKTKTKKGKKSNDTSPSFLRQGGPDVLASKEIQKSGRTLFLCYPDEDDDDDDNDADADAEINVMRATRHDDDEEDDDEEEDDEEDSPELLPSSMGWQCLHHYSGEYVIHVGETFLDATMSMEQAPWGRSSSPEFQQRLASEYHCLLKVELPNWLHTRDSLTVWKRSMISTIVFAGDDDDDDEEDDEEEQEVEEVEYRHIPRDERLPVNLAAPCLAHLLPTTTTTSSNQGSKADKRILTLLSKTTASDNSKPGIRQSPDPSQITNKKVNATPKREQSQRQESSPSSNGQKKKKKQKVGKH